MTSVKPSEVREQAVTRPSRATRARRLLSPGLITGVAIVVVGYLVPGQIFAAHGMTVLVNGVLLGLSALSVSFLLDLLGWVSFGAAVFSGGGAYLFGILCVSWNQSVTSAAILAVVGATIASVLIGLIFVRSRALVFTMLTLALGQLLIQVVSLDGLRSVTGGSDGIVVTPTGSLGSLSATDIADAGLFWPLVWTVAIVAVVVVTVIGRTRLGRILRGIRENEPRMRHAGFNTYLPKLAAFGVAGLLGAVAGVLQAAHTGFVSPDLISFGASGNAIIAALVGGYSAPAGALIGGILLIWGEDRFGASGELYLYTGIALIVVLAVFPRGIVGVGEYLRRRFTRKRPCAHERSADVVVD